MADLEIEIKGLDKLIKKLDAVTLDSTLRPAMKGAVTDVQGALKKYPEPYSGNPPFAGFKTDKQRRWFFWALKSGVITVPYKRKKAAGLGGSWATEIRGSGASMTGVVGTNIPYAKYVQNEPDQYYLHRGRWTTVQDVAKNADIRSKILGRFKVAVDGALAK